MIYKNFPDIRRSMLKINTVRLPVIGGNDAQINEAASMKLVDQAMAQGIHYYDTAWDCHGGTPELVPKNSSAATRFGAFSPLIASCF